MIQQFSLKRNAAQSLTTVFLVLCCLVGAVVTSAPAGATSILTGTKRVVFIGDSITGLGGNVQDGWIHLIDWALQQDPAGAHPVLVPLGGSGQSVESWLSVENDSRTASRMLDVPGYDVKSNLDQHADVVVIMLGMNDLLAPYVGTSEASLSGWEKAYRSLIGAVRLRATPTMIGLATITPCGEDLDAPRNRIRHLLNERLTRIAQAETCIVLPTGDEEETLLALGRTRSSTFHVTQDYVHPNSAGHVALAIGVLKGLGADAAATALSEKYLPETLASTAPNLPVVSCVITPLAGSQGSNPQFELRYWYTPSHGESPTTPKAAITVPAGWHASAATPSPGGGSCTLTGVPDRQTSQVGVSVSTSDGPIIGTATVRAPWLVSTGGTNEQAWPFHKFDPLAGVLPWDSEVATGHPTTKLSWKSYYASTNYTGGANPASLDFTAVSAGETFEVGYAMQWIHSDKDRPVKLDLGSNVFAGSIGLTVWLNGGQKYASVITSESSKHVEVDASIHAGWNSLSVKCNHLTWLWQVLVGVKAVPGDTLDNLRYSLSEGR